MGITRRGARWLLAAIVATVAWGCEDQGPEVEEVLERGMTAVQAGDMETAKAAFREALAVDSLSAEAHFRLGYMYEISDSLADAQDAYTRAITLAPAMMAARYNLALLLARAGNFADAETEFKRTIRLLEDRPDTALAPLPHYCLGLIYSAQGRDLEALAAQKRAVELDSNLAYAHNELGQINLKLGQLDRAEASLLRAVAIKEDFAAAHYNLMMVYMRQRRPDLGSRHRGLFEKYREMSQDDWKPFYQGE